MNEYMKLLGFEVRDVVTGFSGVLSSVSFDLYGCVQAIVTPEFKDGKQDDSRWFDLKRLEAISDKPIMAIPSFAEVPGGQNLPQYPSKPSRGS
jgi:hypothetical protein